MSKFAFRLLPNSKICCLSPSKSAFCEGDFLGVCLFFNGLMLISVSTASWSLTPGMTLQTLTMFFFVMTRSRVLFALVGIATSWIRLKTSNRATNW